jgi:hypothetical protein
VGLQVRNCVRDYWDEFLGHKYSLKAYFLNYLLPCMQSPLVVAIDEVDILFNYPDLAEDFFAFLRTLYEEARNNTTLQKLRFVITHSTDVYLPLDNNQSPFNIGLLAELPLLNSKDVDYLATQYNLNLSSIEINQLLQWVGGNPYLIRLALHNIYYKNATFEQIISPKFTVNNYIYKEHLQQQLAYVVSEKLGLTSAFAQLIKAQNPIEIDLEAAMKLQGLGLINLSGKQAYCSCQLYTEYFREHLG